jgi:hypothetical protein
VHKNPTKRLYKNKSHTFSRSTKAIRLPDFECKSCVLRLTQFTDNTDTEVVSCADVQILQLAADSNSTTSVVPQSKGLIHFM